MEKLRELQVEAVYKPEWMAHDIDGDGKAETFCNRASAFISEGMGSKAIRSDQYANDQIDALALDADWTEDTIERGHAHAMKGGLAFVTMHGQAHGHLCSISSEPMQASGTWGRDVPIMANVGTKEGHGMVKLSKAFTKADIPSLRVFLYRASGPDEIA